MTPITCPQPPACIAGNEAAQALFYDMVADLAAYRSKLAEMVQGEALEEVMTTAVGVVDVAADQAQRFPKYWKPIPYNWRFIDTYRVGVLFPTNDPSTRLDHARKKLLVPGVRTGGKTLRHDVSEAHATLHGWLIDNP